MDYREQWKVRQRLSKIGFPPPPPSIPDGIVLNNGATLQQTLADPKLRKEYLEDLYIMYEKKIFGNTVSDSEDNEKVSDAPTKLSPEERRKARMDSIKKRRENDKQ